jgi:hypothetical protein
MVLLGQAKQSFSLSVRLFVCFYVCLCFSNAASHYMSVRERKKLAKRNDQNRSHQAFYLSLEKVIFYFSWKNQTPTK